MLRRKRVLAVAAVVLLLATLVAGTALAQTPTPQPGEERTNYRELFLDKLTSILGITRDELKSAVQQAGNETLDEAVANGDLTQTQADRLRERAKDKDFGLPFFGDARPGRRGHPGAFGHAFTMAIQGPIADGVAEALGMSTDELKSALRSGKGMAELAAEKGVSAEAIKESVVAHMTASVNSAVENGQLTQAQADRILEGLKQMPADHFFFQFPKKMVPRGFDGGPSLQHLPGRAGI